MRYQSTLTVALTVALAGATAIITTGLVSTAAQA